MWITNLLCHSQVLIYLEVIPFPHMGVKLPEPRKAVTNLVLALLSPKRQQTRKPWTTYICIPASTRANPPQ